MDQEYPQFLNLNQMSNEWPDQNHNVSEDRKLELRLGLGPPAEFLGYNNNTTTHGTKRAFQFTDESKIDDQEDWSTEKQCQKVSCTEKKTGDTTNSTPTPWSYASTPYSTFQGDTKKACSSRMAEVQFPDRKACSSLATAEADTATNNTSNKRIAYSSVVGWPPIRSFRKNLASSSLSKPASESPNKKEDSGGKAENWKTQLFIKINMEGIPIGRKVNLRAYNSYEELSLAIDELFSGLLAAQRDSSATQYENKFEELAKADAGSLAGSGEYTLIYEDDEGDRVLVGDVPWHMFVSTAKRLHVLKSSELSTL